MRRICAFLLVVMAPMAAAQVDTSSPRWPDLRDIAHARNVAMGGAYESLGYGAEAIDGNPAAIALYKRYQIEASGMYDVLYGYGSGSVGLADSTNALATGVSYTFATFHPNGDTSQRAWAHITTLALAYSFGDIFQIGVAGRLHDIIGPAGVATDSITMNAGITVRPVNFLMFGISGHNLIPVGRPQLIPMYFVGSVGAQIAGQLTPVFDLVADFNKAAPRFAYRGGVEWLIADTVPVRAGYQYDAIVEPNDQGQFQGHHYVSGGIGYFNQGSGVDVAYRHEIGGFGRMISLTLKLQL